MILITSEIFGFLNFLNYNGKEINYESIYGDFFFILKFARAQILYVRMLLVCLVHIQFNSASYFPHKFSTQMHSKLIDIILWHKSKST